MTNTRDWRLIVCTSTGITGVALRGVAGLLSIKLYDYATGCLCLEHSTGGFEANGHQEIKRRPD